MDGLALIRHGVGGDDPNVGQNTRALLGIEIYPDESAARRLGDAVKRCDERIDIRKMRLEERLQPPVAFEQHVFQIKVELGSQGCDELVTESGILLRISIDASKTVDAHPFAMKCGEWVLCFRIGEQTPRLGGDLA